MIATASWHFSIDILNALYKTIVYEYSNAHQGSGCLNELGSWIT